MKTEQSILQGTPAAPDTIWDEACCICQRALFSPDSKGALAVGQTSDGVTHFAHIRCYANFAKLLQTLPSQRLYELANPPGKEGVSDG